MLVIRLSAFALGGVVAAALHLKFKWPHLWSVTAGIAVYVVVDIVLERTLFGYVG